MISKYCSEKTVSECPYDECDGEGYIYAEYLNRDGTGFDEFVSKCICRKSFEEVEDLELAN